MMQHYTEFFLFHEAGGNSFRYNMCRLQLITSLLCAHLWVRMHSLLPLSIINVKRSESNFKILHIFYFQFIFSQILTTGRTEFHVSLPVGG